MKVSLKLTLILLFVVLVPLFIIGYATFYSIESIMTQTVESNLETGVNLRVKYIDGYTKHLMYSFSMLSNNSLIKEVLASRDLDKLTSLFKYAIKEHGYYDMFLISKNGNVLCTVKKESDLNKNLNDVFFTHTGFSKAYHKAISEKKTVISSFLFYKPSNKYAAFIVSPVLQNNQVIGAIAVQLNIDALIKLFDDYSGLGKTGELVLLQKSDNKIKFLRKLQSDHHNTKQIDLSHIDTSLLEKKLPVKMVLQEKSGSAIVYDYRGVKVITAWDYIKSFKMGMIVKVDVAEAYGDISYLKNVFLFFGLILMVVILYVIYHVTKLVAILEKTQNRYQFAINGTEDGLWDWDIKNNKIYFSSRFKSMLGYKKDEIKNSLTGWEKLVHPDDFARMQKEIALCQQDQNRDYNQTYRLLHKNGNYIWVADRGKTYFDKNGRAIRMAGFRTDITKTKIQELKIKRLSRVLTNTMNSFNSLVFVKDEKFIYIECNKVFEDFVGLKKEDIIGKSDFEIFDEQTATVFRQRDEIILKESKARSNYEWVTGSNGKEVYFLTMKAPLYDDNKNVVGLVGNAVDMTESYRDKVELRNKEEIMIAQSRHAAMGEMISMIAHQWRQPISVIAMDANNILVDIELEMIDEDELGEAAKDIISQTQELSRTIDDFRDFFKPDRSKEKILLLEVYNDAFNVIGKSLQNNNINIKTNIDESLEVVTFKRELMQVFINIIKNAKEVLVEKDEDRAIELSIKEEEIEVIISICDNGGGIEEENLDKIFNPYFTTKGEKNGTGLGLYMSKTIVEKHLQGRIYVENLKDGACFYIALPKQEEVEQES